jgi:hypothetical protein
MVLAKLALAFSLGACVSKRKIAFTFLAIHFTFLFALGVGYIFSVEVGIISSSTGKKCEENSQKRQPDALA